MNLSLGDYSGWTESATSVVASRVAGQGIIVAVAAGNDVSSSISYLCCHIDHKISRVNLALGTLKLLQMVSMSFLWRVLISEVSLNSF